ncbi:hypothetical protein AMTR_s00108p00106230, partial [Amborella trichopoda]
YKWKQGRGGGPARRRGLPGVNNKGEARGIGEGKEVGKWGEGLGERQDVTRGQAREGTADGGIGDRVPRTSHEPSSGSPERPRPSRRYTKQEGGATMTMGMAEDIS